MSILVAEKLGKSYSGFQAVRDVSFALEAGEILALIGPNGAGKSTCFAMIDGQLTPTHGWIAIFGVDTAGMAPGDIWRLGVGRTFQVAATFASMTVAENVQMALISHHPRRWLALRWAARYHLAEAERLLDLVGMADQAQRSCGELAYGDLKRLELAIALANNPKLLLMDEPAAGMAPRERHALMGLTARIAREHTIGVLFTEHDMDVVFGYADRVLVLNRGTLIAEGAPATVRADAEVRRFISAQARSMGPIRERREALRRRTRRGLRPSAGAVRRFARDRCRRSGRAARSQRRGRIDDVPRDPWACRPTQRQDRFRRRGHFEVSALRDRAAWPRLCAGGP